MQKQDAYMFCASDLLENMTDKENVARRGCQWFINWMFV